VADLERGQGGPRPLVRHGHAHTEKFKCQWISARVTRMQDNLEVGGASPGSRWGAYSTPSPL